MKISSNNVGGFRRMEGPSSPQRAENTSKAFSLKSKTEASAAAPRNGVAKTAAADSPVASALRSVAADFKAGRIPNREEAVRRMVSTVLEQQFGPKMAQDRGFVKMEQSISNLISDDPSLSSRMESLLRRLA